MKVPEKSSSLYSRELATSLSRSKNGRRNKSERDLKYSVACVIGWTGFCPVGIILQKRISNHMLGKDNDTTELGSAMFFDNGPLKLR